MQKAHLRITEITALLHIKQQIMNKMGTDVTPSANIISYNSLARGAISQAGKRPAWPCARGLRPAPLRSAAHGRGREPRGSLRNPTPSPRAPEPWAGTHLAALPGAGAPWAPRPTQHTFWFVAENSGMGLACEGVFPHLDGGGVVLRCLLPQSSLLRFFLCDSERGWEGCWLWLSGRGQPSSSQMTSNAETFK